MSAMLLKAVATGRTAPLPSVERIATLDGVKVKIIESDSWEGGSTADVQGQYLRMTWVSPLTPVRWWTLAGDPE